MLSSQILLTRLLSVVFWHHFVFMILSIVMFGLTLGAIAVYFEPKNFTDESTIEHIVRYSLRAGVSILISFFSLFFFPKFIFTQLNSLDAIYYSYFVILMIPFLHLGIVFSLVLTRFPERVGKIYAVNLIGSAAGCLGIYVLLNNINGASAICVLVSLCWVAAYLFSRGLAHGSGYAFKTVLLLVIVALSFGAVNQKYDLVQFSWKKGSSRSNFHTKWNFFSFISVCKPSMKPFGWAFSPKINERFPIATQELMILIDEGAGTVMTRFRDLSELEYLKYDVSAFAHHIRKADSVLVIGSGGGRDLLTAGLFGSKKITGVEINKDILDIAFNKFAYFTKNIRKFPQIRMLNEDGRSSIVRSREKYDLIQMSLVDSFSAGSAGALALSENSLYTTEAWQEFLGHLTPDGILTFTRFYHRVPLEIYRLLPLAKSALERSGITDVRRHIVLIRCRSQQSIMPDVGTILVSQAPFSADELSNIEATAKRYGFEVELSADRSRDPNYELLLNERTKTYRLPDLDINLTPPTDDKPFFFYFGTFRNFIYGVPGIPRTSDPLFIGGSYILRQTSGLLLILGGYFIFFVSIMLSRTRGMDRIELSPSLYFASIGLAFMFLEVPLIQRLGLFLGHPVYGLTVVLFSLLFSCGVGSYLSRNIKSPRGVSGVFAALLVLIALTCAALPFVIRATMASPIALKIVVAMFCTGLLGCLMGFPFPMGVAFLARGPKSPLIFYWSINGFASMCSAALATIALIHFGFLNSVMIAGVFYLAAFYFLWRIVAKRKT